MAEKDVNKPVIRVIRRLKDGATKNAASIIAARLVNKGTHAYADDGPDESKNIPKTRRISTIEKTPADIISLAKIPQIEMEGDGNDSPYVGPQKVYRADEDMIERGSTTDLQPRPDRKITKKSDIPKEKLDFILRTNVANPATVQGSRDSGSLKEVMDRVRSKRG